MEVLFCWIYLIIPIVLSGIYLYCCFKLNYWKRRGVQQLINTNKIFGDIKNAILFRTPPGYHLKDIYREAPSGAPYVGFYIFHKPCLLLRDPELIKQILIRDFDNFSNRYFGGSLQKDSIDMVNLFGLKNPAWRYLRKKITPTLNRNALLKQMLPLMTETGQPMMDYLKRNINNDYEAKVINIQDVNKKYAADLIANVGFGLKIDSFTYPDSYYSKRLLDFFYSFKRMVALVTLFYVPELVDLVGPRMLFDTSFVHDIFRNAVESREKNGETKGDFIDSIIQLKNGEQDPIFKFEGDNLLDQTGTIFALESSSIASAFTLMELAKHKGYQDRARADIKNAISKHGWTIEAFNDMKYVDQCIAEGIRMQPSAPIVDRYPLQDYKIPNTDVTIEKGTPIYISLYGLHGDPQYFDEPDVFRPERFNDGVIIPDAYMPFGSGPKQCIGIKMGKLHVKVVLSMILSEYEVYQKPSEENKLDSRKTFPAAADGIHIEFTKLNQ